MVIFPITSNGRVEKSQKKKKIFLKDVLPCGFPISGDEKGEKSKWFFFFPSGESKKGEIDYKKKENFFSPLGSFLTNFGG